MTPAELRSWRMQLGLNRAALGMILGISPRTVEFYEQGGKIPRCMAMLIEFKMKEAELNQMIEDKKNKAFKRINSEFIRRKLKTS